MPERPTLAVFDTKPYDRAFLDAANAALPGGPAFEPRYLEVALRAATAPLAAGCPAVCGFVHDNFDAEALGVLAAAGVQAGRVALRRLQQRRPRRRPRAWGSPSCASPPTRRTPSPSTRWR